MRTNQRSQKYGDKCSSEERKQCFCGTHIKRQKKNGDKGNISSCSFLTWDNPTTAPETTTTP